MIENILKCPRCGNEFEGTEPHLCPVHRNGEISDGWCGFIAWPKPKKTKPDPVEEPAEISIPAKAGKE